MNNMKLMNTIDNLSIKDSQKASSYICTLFIYTLNTLIVVNNFLIIFFMSIFHTKTLHKQSDNYLT